MRLITITSILFATAHVAFSVPVYSLAPRAQDGVGAEGLIPASHGVVQRDDNEEQDLFVRELFAREFFSDEPHGLFTRGQRTSNTRGQRTSNTRGGVRFQGKKKQGAKGVRGAIPAGNQKAVGGDRFQGSESGHPKLHASGRQKLHAKQKYAIPTGNQKAVGGDRFQGSESGRLKLNPQRDILSFAFLAVRLYMSTLDQCFRRGWEVSKTLRTSVKTLVRSAVTIYTDLDGKIGPNETRFTEWIKTEIDANEGK
ncbi:hypothetical protein K439DRAFT_1661166 [Ramaria rubella]|nr:hypothetical protein K439DRAFT_1661166 [Ramaria rubella]